MLENIFFVAAVLLFVSTFLPKRTRQKIRNAPAHLLPFLAAAAKFLAAHAGQLAALAWRFFVELGRLVEPLLYRAVTGRDPHARTGQMFAFETREPYTIGGSAPPSVPADFPLPAAESTPPHGGEPTPEEGEIAPATPEEVIALARALRHNLTSADKTKAGAIRAGWGIKTRSGTDPKYRRASQLYDLATKEPAPERKEPVIRRRNA
ncbi:hypothetical protein SE17_27450 [Kouleothrix aurantiaca]|uniref:Uncharacterized protein n=1 Tax=Kouleothrix aurantiaca TaxID=186479 RepID=A0A0P9DKH6_9CHLR|nr:hypothetical protein SE17_27450 [Kouleothrix aurantiaca]